MWSPCVYESMNSRTVIWTSMLTLGRKRERRVSWSAAGILIPATCTYNFFSQEGTLDLPAAAFVVVVESNNNNLSISNAQLITVTLLYQTSCWIGDAIICIIYSKRFVICIWSQLPGGSAIRIEHSGADGVKAISPTRDWERSS